MYKCTVTMIPRPSQETHTGEWTLAFLLIRPLYAPDALASLSRLGLRSGGLGGLLLSLLLIPKIDPRRPLGVPSAEVLHLLGALSRCQVGELSDGNASVCVDLVPSELHGNLILGLVGDSLLKAL
jgi:hypothetical protein